MPTPPHPNHPRPNRPDPSGRSRHPLGTAVVPLVTALDAAGRPDPELAAPLLAHLHAAGITSLLLLGSNGEGPNIPTADAARYAAGIQQRWQALAGPAGHVMATAAGISTVDALTRAEALATAGITTLVAMPPLYYKHTESELAAHLAAITDLGLPTVIYDQPTYTGNPLTLPVYDALLTRPNLIGVKQSGTAPTILTALAARTTDHPGLPGHPGLLDGPGIGGHPGFAVASGTDRGMITALDLGATGLVLGTSMLAPRAVLDLLAAHAAGDTARAATLQSHLEDLLAMHRIRPATSGVVATKTALSLLGLAPATATAPFTPFTPTETATLRSLLTDSPITPTPH